MAAVVRAVDRTLAFRDRGVRVREAHLDPAPVRAVQGQRADPEGAVRAQVHELRRVFAVAELGTVLHERGGERRRGEGPEGANERFLRRGGGEIRRETPSRRG